MRIEAISDTGLVRKGNEDSFLINKALGLFAVADGMGGHEAGEVASFLAVKTLETAVRDSKGREGALEAAIKAANQEIYSQAQQKSSLAGMGTTLTAVYYQEDGISIGHVGDSRAYLIRDSQATLLTRDHSLVAELIRSGQISEEEGKNHPHRHVVTRALGTEPEVEVDMLFPGVKQGDRLFLCTDGLSNLIKSEEIAQTVDQAAAPEQALELLKQMALERGGFDNLTALLIEF